MIFRTSIFAALVLSLCSLGCQPKSTPDPDSNTPPIAEPDKPEQLGGNGLSNRVFGNCLRVRTQSGTGSGSIIDETASHYVMESNHHVSSKGTPNQLDIFVGGKNVGSVRATTTQSWFRNGKAHDLSETLIPKSALGGPLPVVPTAPSGYTSRLKVGQPIYTYGCQQGQWPRARHGNIVGINNGLIYYEPESIPGDSGSGVYLYDPELGELCIGRTAWTTENFNGKPAGIAMSSDRVRAIRNGEVSFDQLPEGVTPIPPAPAMESDDANEVFIRRWKSNWDSDEPSAGVRQGPLNLGMMRQGGMTLRAGLGYAVMMIGLAVGVGVVLYVIHVLRR